jgi:hypothetical protein
VFDLDHEHLIRFQDVAALIPGRVGTLDPSTIWRWALRGVSGPGGKRVKLRAAKIGGRWTTSREAVSEFLLALNPGRSDNAPMPRTPGKRARANDRAKKQLASVGI